MSRRGGRLVRCGTGSGASRRRSRLLHRADGGARRGCDVVEEHFHQPQNLHELALALLAHPEGFEDMPGVMNSSGNRQSASEA